jgi:hypothetical protein
MKRALAVLILLVTATSFANDVRYTIEGRGRYVCATKNSLTHGAFVVREMSLKSSREFAKRTCEAQSGPHASGCAYFACEIDHGANSNAPVSFDLGRNDNTVLIQFAGEAIKKCTNESSSSHTIYEANAPTELEARVLAHNFCQTEHKEGLFCEELEASPCLSL